MFRNIWLGFLEFARTNDGLRFLLLSFEDAIALIVYGV